MVADLREGWRYFVGTTWLWVVVLAFGVLNALSAGAFGTLGPVLAKETSIGETGWGLVLSARGGRACCCCRWCCSGCGSSARCFWGMVGMRASTACRCSRSASSRVAGRC